MKGHHRFIRWLALLLLWTVNAQLATVFAQLTFTTSTYHVGLQPQSVAAADVNGDGKLDLVSANNGSGTLTLLTNNGTGAFGSNATLSVGNHPVSVVAADVNGDGKLDLISANSDDNTLTVLTNNGSGAFGLNATLSVGSESYCVVAADVNNDGKLDLISANSDDNTLTVLTNNGSGAFGLNATLSVGSEPYCVVAADVNNDGKPDLVSANYHDNTLTVLTNNGNGAFGFNATLTVGSSPSRVEAADVNGDGNLDLISANTWGHTLTVLTNNGSGAFGFNATLSVRASPSCIVAADVSGDGKVDLVTAHFNGLAVLTNNGTGAFGSNSIPNEIILAYCVVVADVNNDGKLDLISQDWVYDTMLVLINTTVFPPPPLNIALAGKQVALSWPAWATNYYFLETTTNLSPPNWAVATGSALVTNSTTGVTLTNSWPAAFFRLGPWTNIFNENFDGGYTGALGLGSFTGGSPTACSNYVATSGGNPNGCWQETMTPTNWSDLYGGQVQLMTVSGNTDTNPANYLLSFDACGSQAANIHVMIQTWTGNYFGGPGPVINTSVEAQLVAANTWQHFSVNLGSLTTANPTGATWQLSFELNSWQWGGPGYTDTLKIDNITLIHLGKP